jgi:hypothetical protein
MDLDEDAKQRKKAISTKGAEKALPVKPKSGSGVDAQESHGETDAPDWANQRCPKPRFDFPD